MRSTIFSTSMLLVVVTAFGSSAFGQGASAAGQTGAGQAALARTAAKMTDWSEVIAVQVTDPAERDLVARYDVSRAPMPLVLAVAPCGAVTKAFTGPVTEAELSAARVSPCTQLCLKAIQDQKLVLLCVVDSNDPRGSALPQGARDFKADSRFGPATEVILVNARDARESSFLKELQVDPRAAKPLTVLLAPPGSVVGTFDARATKDQFVARLAAAQSNPCADGTCGPNGCGPRK
jgi:hypothetical protein